MTVYMVRGPGPGAWGPGPGARGPGPGRVPTFQDVSDGGRHVDVLEVVERLLVVNPDDPTTFKGYH